MKIDDEIVIADENTDEIEMSDKSDVDLVNNEQISNEQSNIGVNAAESFAVEIDDKQEIESVEANSANSNTSESEPSNPT